MFIGLIEKMLQADCDFDKYLVGTGLVKVFLPEHNDVILILF